MGWWQRLNSTPIDKRQDWKQFRLNVTSRGDMPLWCARRADNPKVYEISLREPDDFMHALEKQLLEVVGASPPDYIPLSHTARETGLERLPPPGILRVVRWGRFDPVSEGLGQTAPRSHDLVSLPGLLALNPRTTDEPIYGGDFPETDFDEDEDITNPELSDPVPVTKLRVNKLHLRDFTPITGSIETYASPHERGDGARIIGLHRFLMDVPGLGEVRMEWLTGRQEGHSEKVGALPLRLIGASSLDPADDFETDGVHVFQIVIYPPENWPTGTEPIVFQWGSLKDYLEHGDWSELGVSQEPNRSTVAPLFPERDHLPSGAELVESRVIPLTPPLQPPAHEHPLLRERLFGPWISERPPTRPHRVMPHPRAPLGGEPCVRMVRLENEPERIHIQRMLQRPAHVEIVNKARRAGVEVVVRYAGRRELDLVVKNEEDTVRLALALDRTGSTRGDKFPVPGENFECRVGPVKVWVSMAPPSLSHVWEFTPIVALPEASVARLM